MGRGGSGGRGGKHPRGANRTPPGHLSSSGNMDFYGQLGHKAPHPVRAFYLRLADKLHRAGAEGVQHPNGGGAYHHHRQGIYRHQLLKEVDAVELGHFHIQGSDVRLQGFDFFHGIHGVHRGANHLDAGIGGQGFGQCLAEEDRIVHNEQPDFISTGVGHGGQLLLW